MRLPKNGVIGSLPRHFIASASYR